MPFNVAGQNDALSGGSAVDLTTTQFGSQGQITIAAGALVLDATGICR